MGTGVPDCSCKRTQEQQLFSWIFALPLFPFRAIALLLGICCVSLYIHM